MSYVRNNKTYTVVPFLNDTFNNISSMSCRGCQFYWWREPEYQLEKNICIPRVIDELDHIMLYQVHLATLVTTMSYVRNNINNILFISVISFTEGRRGRDHIVVGLTTTYAISAYHQ
jgi:hypothetical protein